MVKEEDGQLHFLELERAHGNVGIPGYNRYFLDKHLDPIGLP